ncbi:hypothetical protein [Streptacidiphilus sp. EB129]|uniref:DUF7002 family protein n=1 Tax=Streptacidiphilus sp. EB129 TaxID=3156262 RepID=UPI003513BAED
MTDDGAWPSIERHGLLSTRALVDLYDPVEPVRSAVLEGVRRSSVTMEHPELGRATVRDQLPLTKFQQFLTPDTTPQEYLDCLNGRVFFWLSFKRLQGLLVARNYRARPQLVLYLDTAELLRRHGDRVQLAPINTGSFIYDNSPPRGKSVFEDVEDYAYPSRNASGRRRPEPVVELTVGDALPDAAALTTRVERWAGGVRTEVLFQR